MKNPGRVTVRRLLYLWPSIGIGLLNPHHAAQAPPTALYAVLGGAASAYLWWALTPWVESRESEP